MGVQQVICAVCVVFLIVLVVIVLTHDADSDLVAGGKANSCPAGKYGNQTGQTVSSSCVSCRSGRFALGDGNERCSLCPKGSYCPNAVSKILSLLGNMELRQGRRYRVLVMYCVLLENVKKLKIARKERIRI